MASTTPNIGLTLPTGAEKVSRQIINDNNTIIDGKMGAVPGGQNLQGEIDALNSKMTGVWLDDVASLDALKSAIMGVVNNLANKQTQVISFGIAYTGDPIFTQWAIYEGLLQVNAKWSNVLRFSVTVTATGSTTLAPIVIAYQGTSSSSGTWEIEKVALNSKIATKEVDLTSTITPASGITTRNFVAYRTGNILVYRMQFDNSSAKANGDTVFSGIPSEYRPKAYFYNLAQSAASTPCMMYVGSDGAVKCAGSGLATGAWYTCCIVGVAS